eukprot:gene11136-12307_t
MFFIDNSVFSNTGQDLVTQSRFTKQYYHDNLGKGWALWMIWTYSVDNSINKNDIIQNWYVVTDKNKNATVIAEKRGKDGTVTLACNLPSFLSKGNRFKATDSNTLLVLRGEYNDTSLEYYSTVKARRDSGSQYITYTLKPRFVVSVTGKHIGRAAYGSKMFRRKSSSAQLATALSSAPCHNNDLDMRVRALQLGRPEFRSSPPKFITISEDEKLLIQVESDGNPKPTIDLQWSHLNTTISMPVEDLYRYYYQANVTYIGAEHVSGLCGRNFTVTATNSKGSTIHGITYVNILFSLDDPKLQAHKPNYSCVFVQWKKKDTGLCNVMYSVSMNDNTGNTAYKSTGINIHQAIICDIPYTINITSVQLTMTSKLKSKTYSATVTGHSYPPRSSTTPSTTVKSTTSITTTDQTSTKPTKSSPTTPNKSGAKKRTFSEASASNLLAIHAAYICVIIILLFVLVGFLIYHRRNKVEKVLETGGQIQQNNLFCFSLFEQRNVGPPPAQTNMHYMELNEKDREKDATYTHLSSGAYEIADPEVKQSVGLLLLYARIGHSSQRDRVDRSPFDRRYCQSLTRLVIYDNKSFTGLSKRGSLVLGSGNVDMLKPKIVLLLCFLQNTCEQKHPVAIGESADSHESRHTKLFIICGASLLVERRNQEKKIGLKRGNLNISKKRRTDFEEPKISESDMSVKESSQGFLKRFKLRRNYKHMHCNKTAMIEAGLEFTKRSKSHMTETHRRNAVCEMDITERAGIQKLLKQYLLWKYMATYEMSHYDFETILSML